MRLRFLARTQSALWGGAVALLFAAPGCTTPIVIGPEAGLDAPTVDAPTVDAPAVLADIGDAMDAPSDTAMADVSDSTDARANDVFTPMDAPTDVRADVPNDVPTDAPRDAPSDASSMCDALYGALPGYELCSETPSECRFHVSLGAPGLGSCRDACDMGGGGANCLRAERTAGGPDRCTAGGSTACGSGGGEICTCRP